MSATDYKQPPSIVLPVLTPEREEKRQNGRRFKDNNEDMFTLTAQDRHGVAVSVPEVIGGIGEEKSNSCNQGVIETIKGNIPNDHPRQYVEIYPGTIVYAVWYEKYQCYIAIRKLTPRECFRLQGWTDDYFEKARFVNSDSQLYKQAGNGVTVNVVEVIGQSMKGDRNGSVHT